MNDCMNAEVRDALPDLIHGRLSDLDRVTMTAHVESCADCRAELELLRQVRASAAFAPRIDVERIVSALPLAIPAVADLMILPAPVSARRMRGPLWKWAAALALLVTGSLTFATARRQTEAPAGVATSVATSVATEVAASAAPSVPISSAASAPLAGTVAPARGGVVAQSAPVATKTVAAGRRVASLSLTGGVQDLTDDQLQTLLNDLDSVQGLPSAEPEAVSIAVDDNEGFQ